MRGYRPSIPTLVALGMALATPAAAGPPLTLVQALRVGVDPGVLGLGGAQEVTVSPDGKHVYTCGQDDNAVTVFARDTATGRLTLVQVLEDGVGGVDGLEGAHGLAVSPDGKHVYVGSRVDELGVFSRDVTTGVLTFVEAQKDGVAGVTNMIGPRTVRVSPDGAHVYVPADASKSIAVFGRNATTGQLTFVEAQVDGVGGVDGLDSARAVALSPDGGHVYVAAANDSAVAVFARNGVTGALTFVEVQKDGVGGVSGLAVARSVQVSPDGKHLYTAASGNEGHVAVFTRDGTTGALTFVTKYTDGMGGIDGLGSATWVAVSPDGTHVYAVSGDDHALVAFARNATTGALTFLGLERDGERGVETLEEATTVAVSPDDAHIYTLSFGDLAVSVFRPFTVACSATPANGCLAPDLPLKAVLLLKEKTPDTGDLLLWRWVKGTTSTGDFGDPVTTLDDYTLCLYDDGGALALEAAVPAGGVCKAGAPCWQATPSGVRYVDAERTPDGVLKAVLKAGTGTGKIVVKAKGDDLPALPPLPLALPVTVQLRTADGPCWTASYFPAGVIRSDAALFKGKAGSPSGAFLQ
jgi:6-phosphogluconolactonase (cycloisomerase 2 family)